MTIKRSARRAVGRVLLGLTRFRLVGAEVTEPRAIFIGAPHTSNLDFLVMLGIAFSQDLHPHVLIKDSYFQGPKARIFRALGGIPVDRANPEGLVADLIERSRAGESFHLVITPEGTRSRGETWRSGFYRIARDADLPVMLGYVDSVTRTTGLGPTLHLTGDIGADMDRIRDFYADKAGIHPEKFTPPKLASETPDDAPAAGSSGSPRPLT